MGCSISGREKKGPPISRSDIAVQDKGDMGHSERSADKTQDGLTKEESRLAAETLPLGAHS